MSYTKNVREIIEQLRIADRQGLYELEKELAGDPRVSIAKAIEAAHRRLDANDAEIRRVKKLYEPIIDAGPGKIVVGIDEVGRGALAGPLTVGAVVLPTEPIIKGLNDSKKLSPSKREKIAKEIKLRALEIAIIDIAPSVIDSKGISFALRSAMAQAIEKLNVDPDLVLIDGNPVHVHPKERCIAKGDSKVACIAAASIVAKVHRDHLMQKQSSNFAGYDFANNKGYGSAEHIAAIRNLGLSSFHRKSFCAGLMQDTLF